MTNSYFGVRRGRGIRRGNLPGSGPGGICVCPSCGFKAPHQWGIPCNMMMCPQCGVPMMKSL